jgi:Catalase
MLALNPDWTERYVGGSPEREAELLHRFTQQIQQVQERNRRSGEPPRRAFHAKLLAGIANARFTVSPDIREELQTPPFTPRATYPTVVRFSNASGMVGSDSDKDLRGIAIRVQLPQGDIQDFLMTNAPASHARNARQFMVAAVALSGGRRLSALPRLVLGLGPFETARMLGALRKASSRPVNSLATETFWSRAPYAVGRWAVKFVLRPLGAPGGPPPEGHDALRHEFVERLKGQDVRFELQVQHYVNERHTPIEDGAVEWTERDPPPETVAELLIPQQDVTTEQSREAEAAIEELAFSPWSSTEGIRPIGGLNRARKPVYQASARLRARES